MKFIYLHTDANDIPFYIGKGNKYRTYDKFNRSKDWNKIASNGFNVKILEIVDDKDADKKEIFWINKYGRVCDGGTLINKTKGGAGKLGNYLNCEPKIHYHTGTNKWVVRQQINGVRKWIGTFDTEQEAILQKQNNKIT